MSMIEPAMRQCLLGLECQDFTMIASDQTNTKSVVLMKNDENKIFPISDHLIMGVNGEPGEILQFSQFIANNLALYQIRNGYKLDTAAAVHFTRKTLIDSMNGGRPMCLNFLMGGWEESNGGQLYILDPLASCVRVPYAVHGFGGFFCFSILDFHHKRNMTESQAYEVMQMCVKEVHERLFLNLPNFQVKVVSKNGITTLPIIFAPRIVASPGLQIDVQTEGAGPNPKKMEKSGLEKPCIIK